MIVHKKSCYTTKTHPSAALRLSWSRREWHSKLRQLLHSKSDIDEDEKMTRNMHNKRENYPSRTSSKDNRSFEEGWSNTIIIFSSASATSDPETPVLHPFDATAQLPINLKDWTTSLLVWTWDIQGSKLIRMPLSFSPSFGCRLYHWQSGEFAPELLGLAV